MKYGETLRQRSVPEWAYHNVDYDSIKRLIKDHTTPSPSKAISIPGQGDVLEKDFENRLLLLLAEEHDRVGLFVRSKTGEIDRRLDHLGRQLHNLEVSTWPPSRTLGKISSARQTKYAKIQELTIQVGEEIKSLTRFINAQKTAFRKLLKKYTKWTRRDSLSARFNSEISEENTGILYTDLTIIFDQWNHLLHRISYAMQGGGAYSQYSSPSLQPTIPKPSSSTVCKRMNDALKSNSDIDFDTAFTYSPLGSEGGRAIYWVHPEQLVELQVLLLQHIRSAFGVVSSSSSAKSPPISRSASFVRRDSSIDKQPDHGVVLIDNAEHFAQKQNSIPISDAEDSYTSSQTQPAATLVWASGNETVFCVSETFEKQTEQGFNMAARLKKKHVDDFLNIHKSFQSQSENSILAEQVNTIEKNIDWARKWLSDRANVEPVVSILSKRLRFTSTPSAADKGQWCTVDTDIYLQRAFRNQFEGKEWSSNVSSSAVSFPYAVLEVRQEGKNNIDLIKLLDESHLTERVRGFSLPLHALWSCCRPKGMTPPFWLPVLNSDIRKFPSAKLNRRTRKPSKSRTRAASVTDTTDDKASSLAGNSSRGGETSTGDTLVDSVQERGAPVSPRSKRKSRQATSSQNSAPTRYWSEYDHPEEMSGDESQGYYIYVDPNAPVFEIPFQHEFLKLYNKLRVWFFHKAARPRSEMAVHEPLLPTTSALPKTPYFVGEEEENDDDASSTSSDDGTPTRYGTFLSHNHDTDFQHHYDQGPDLYDHFTPLLIATMCLFFAITLSLVLLVLAEVHKHRNREEVDIVTILGAIVSLVFGAAGVYGLVNGGRAGWTRILVAVLVGGTVVLADCVLFVKLVTEILWVSN